MSVEEARVLLFYDRARALCLYGGRNSYFGLGLMKGLGVLVFICSCGSGEKQKFI